MSVVWGRGRWGTQRGSVCTMPINFKNPFHCALAGTGGPAYLWAGWLATSSHIKNIVNGMEGDCTGSRWVPCCMTLRVADIFRTVPLPHPHPTTTNSGGVRWSSAANVPRPNFYRKTSSVKPSPKIFHDLDGGFLPLKHHYLFIIILFINFWDLLTQFLKIWELN